MVRPWAVTPANVAYIESFPPDMWPNGFNTLYTYLRNSYLVPSILRSVCCGFFFDVHSLSDLRISYVILATFAVFVLLVAVSPILARLRLPLRSIDRFLSAPTFGKRYSAPLTIVPALPSNPSYGGEEDWVSLHLPLRWQSFAILALIISNIVGVTAFYTPTPGPTNL